MQEANPQPDTNALTFPLWDFELILFTHNYKRKPLPSSYTDEEANYIHECIELQFKKVLNSQYYKDNEVCRVINLLVKLSVHFSTKLSEGIESTLKEYITVLKEFYEKNKSKISHLDHIFLLHFYIIQGLFLKENWLGKSYLFHDADYKLKKAAEIKLKNMGMEDKIKVRVIDNFDYNAYLERRIDRRLDNVDLNKYDYPFIKSADYVELRSDKLKEFLVVDGEEIFRKLNYMGLFVLIKEYLKNINEIIQVPLPSTNLWKARTNFLHNKILNEKLTSLQVDVLKQYNTFFEEATSLLDTEIDIKACLKLEFGNVLLYYYKYDKCLKAFNEAQELRKLNIKFTGKLGFMTKYQIFETAQLIVEAQPQESPAQDDAEAKIGDEDTKPVNVALDEETILLEKPRLLDLNTENLQKELYVYDQMIVLCIIYHLQKTTPKDDLLQEQVTAYLRSIMDKANNWLVHSMALYVRSLNEFARYKTKERSLWQLQSLVDQFNDRKPSAYERIKFYYSLYYPSFLELQRTMAEKYMEIGMVMSSSELFEKLDMLEESVECLSMAGREEKAKERALELMEKKPTAKMYCIYGELTGDISYYQKAWEFSNKRFARAKRSEAKYYFNRNKFDEAIESFKAALEVNTYHASTWFTLGCAYLKVQKYHDAVIAFGQVVSIDETQGEAWANMAAALSVQGKKLEAFNALQQSVKHNENSWKIWQNLMMVSLEAQKFKTFLEAVDRLLKLQAKQCVDAQVLKKISQVFLFQIDEAVLGKIVDLNFYFKRITSIYKTMEDKLATQPYFWHAYQSFTELQKLYNEKLIELEKELDQTPDLQPAYVEHVRKRLQDRTPDQAIDDRIADLCLKECHSIMIVGWEDDKRLCKQLEAAIERMKDAYLRIKDEKKLLQLKIFLDSNVPKIRKTLDE